MKKRNNSRNVAKFTEEEMRQAVLRVAEYGETVNHVSQEVGFCKKTLKSYVDKYLSTDPDKKYEFVFRPNYEINQVFTHELEKIFKEYLLSVNKSTRRINRAYIRKSAFEFAQTCNLHVPKSWNVRRQAGLDWMYGFFNRHPVIKHTVTLNKKLKAGKIVPNYDDAAREDDRAKDTEDEIIALEDVEMLNASQEDWSECIAVSSSPITVVSNLNRLKHSKSACGQADFDENTQRRDHYFSGYMKSSRPASAAEAPAEGVNIFTEFSVKTPIDEFADNLREAYCAISQDGYVPSDRVYNLDEIALMAENPFRRKMVTTACCFVSAKGRPLAPFMVFPRPKLKKCMLRGYPSGVCAVASQNGVINDTIFLYILQHFRDLTHASPTNKVVLIVDDDDSHVTVNTIDYCENHGIELVTLPPHCAGRLQPIGLYVFKTLKAHFGNAIGKYRANNPDKYISMYDVSSLFNAIYPYSFTEENIMCGFNETGVYPLDDKVLSDIDGVALTLVRDDSPPQLLEHEVELIPSGIRSSDESESEDDDVISVGEIKFDVSREKHKKSAQVEQMLELPSVSSLATEYDLNLAVDFEKTPLEEYFDDLVFAYNELNRNGGISPDLVFNMDEIELVVRTSQNDDSGLRLVTCCIVNAAGKSLAPFFVYPFGSLTELPPDSGIEGAQCFIMDQFTGAEDVFIGMLEHFAKQVPSMPQKRVILVIDDEHGHISIKSMDFVSKVASYWCLCLRIRRNRCNQLRRLCSQL